MRRLVWVSILACLLGCPHAPEPVTFDAYAPKLAAKRFAVVGDLQRTGRPELLLGREENDSERKLVLEAIANEAPQLLVLTGDSVFEGTNAAHWQRFEDDTIRLRTSGIPVVTAFGNHEYYPFPYVGLRAGARKDAEKNLFARFQFSRGHWFVVPFGELRIVVLDSNREALSDDEWRDQVRWFDRRLDDFDAPASADVKGVVVAFHHPPFTNSALYGEGEHVRADLQPVFAKHRKTMAMLNGHVHSYERFVFEKKTYVVSGGGGGPRVTLGAARFPDAFSGPALRDFHYTTYAVDERGLHAVVHGLGKGETAFRPMDTFDMPWPDAAPAP